MNLMTEYTLPLALNLLTCAHNHRDFLLSILNLPRMTFTSLENHMLATTFPHLLLEFTKETKTRKGFT